MTTRFSKIILNISIVAIAVAALFLPLFIWQRAYPSRDEAALVVIFLAPILFLGRRFISFAIYRARIDSIIKKQSFLRRIFTGWLPSIGSASAFMIVVIALLAYQVLISDIKESMAMLALCFLSGIVFLALQPITLSHLKRPFSNAGAIWIATIGCTISFAAIIVFMSYGDIAKAIHDIDVYKTIDKTLIEYIETNMTPRRGFIAEWLVYFYAYEALKLWAIAQLGSPSWGVALLSVEGGLIGFILARSGITITLFMQTIILKGLHVKTFRYKENIEKDQDVQSASISIKRHTVPIIATFAYIIFLSGMAVAVYFFAPSDGDVKNKNTRLENLLVKANLDDDFSKLWNDKRILDAKKIELEQFEDSLLRIEANLNARSDLIIERWEIDFDNFIEKDARPFARREVRQSISSEIEDVLSDIYAPVYDGIPGYVAYYYLEAGDYMEPNDAMLEELNARLYFGFNQRLSGSASKLKNAMLDSYNNALNEIILAKYPLDKREQVIAKIIAIKIEQSIENSLSDIESVTISIPVFESPAEDILGEMAKSAIKRGAEAEITKVLNDKSIIGHVKPDRKGRGVLCPPKRWPWIPGCGKKIVITIDEYFRQDEFEAELRDLIHQDKAAKRELLMKAFDEGGQ